jgi:hypothetical protein
MHACPADYPHTSLLDDVLLRVTDDTRVIFLLLLSRHDVTFPEDLEDLESAFFGTRTWRRNLEGVCVSACRGVAGCCF